MSDQLERRRHVDAEIASLKALIMEKFDGVHQRFDGTDMRLDSLTEQVTETNGRLRTAEKEIADTRPRVQTLEREMGDVRRVIEAMGAEVRSGLQWVRDQIHTMAMTIKTEARAVTKSVTKGTGEDRSIIQRDVVVYMAGIGSAMMAWQFVSAVINFVKGLQQ